MAFGQSEVCACGCGPLRVFVFCGSVVQYAVKIVNTRC